MSGLTSPANKALKDRFVGIHRMYQSHSTMLVSDEQTKEAKMWAWTYWKKWPLLKSMAEPFFYDFAEAGEDPDEYITKVELDGKEEWADVTPRGLRKTLACVNESSTGWLIRSGIRLGFDCSAIEKTRPIVRRLILAEDPMPRLADYESMKNWPDCLGDDLYEMPAAAQAAIMDAQASFAQLVGKLEMMMLDSDADEAVKLIADHDEGDDQRTITISDIESSLKKTGQKGRKTAINEWTKQPGFPEPVSEGVWPFMAVKKWLRKHKSLELSHPLDLK